MTDLATYRQIAKAQPFFVHPSSAALFEGEIAARMRTYSDRERPSYYRRLERLFGGEMRCPSPAWYADEVTRYLSSGQELTTRDIARAIGIPTGDLRWTMGRMEAEGLIERRGVSGRNHGTIWGWRA